jgi:uncharacterized membrane protein
MRIKTFIMLFLLTTTQVLGDIWLSKGMKGFGEIDSYSFTMVINLLTYLLTNYWILLGVATLIISLIIYLIAISKHDLSYVLPIHSSSHILNLLLAWLILGENIPLSRWFTTSLIALGVLCVGLSESQTAPPIKTKKITKNLTKLPFFMLPLGISKTWLTIIIISVADASGDLLLALGMKQVGEVKLTSVAGLFKKLKQIVTNTGIIGGITCQAIAFFGFISILTWADISFVRPATALTYIFSLLGAKFILQETIKNQKLIGIILIGTGILFHR